jgi:hypothetical protein
VKSAFDTAAVRTLLQRGINNGWWTLSDLGTPSPGFRDNTRVQHRAFPHGYQGIQHRNLLLDSPPIPRPTAEAASGPEKAPEPPAPVPTTPDPSDWPF